MTRRPHRPTTARRADRLALAAFTLCGLIGTALVWWARATDNRLAHS